ncbi:MAG: DNA polymerase III, subunit gamma and tau [Rhodothermaceae bacterium]|nr:MAG: DNA polymerase III, subunit gamma and tau [Rhodothermaceae bacterium]
MPEQRYLVTARKYRPQRFSEVVAQEHVTETLKNALRMDRLAHAYLFSGPRGVGKTTAARILAKAINCTTPPAERDDAAEPCRRCEACLSFEAGRSLNIIELDAASNNSVNDIRELQETIRIPPQGARKKVYIIDEVHMLSQAAFNAFLKTLEEPPPYALFIFATTEPHKVLPTILSRCQRFDFRRIAVSEIIAQLRHICREEAITADEASLMLIARKGDGALRDALSVFDQAVSLCGTDLRHDELTRALGVVSTDLFFEVTRNVVARDGGGMLRLVDRIVRAGYDLQEFVDGLTEHLRNLLVARTMPDTTLIEAVEATRQAYATHSRDFTETDLLRLLLIATETEDALKTSRQPRLRLETALLKMAALTRSTDLRTALARLDHLEQMLAAGRLPADLPAAAGPDAGTAEHRNVQRPAPAKSERPGTARDARTPETGTPEDRNDAREETEPAKPEAEEEEPAGVAHSPQPDPRTPSPEAPSSQPDTDLYPTLFGPPALKKRTSRGDGSGPQGSVDVAVAEAPAAPAPGTDDAPMLRRIEGAWTAYVQAVKKARIHVGALLQHTAPLDVRHGTVLVAVPDDFHQRLLGSQHDFLLKQLRTTTREEIARLQFVIRPEVKPAADEDTGDAFDARAYFQHKRAENPVLQAIFEQFGGEIVW